MSEFNKLPAGELLQCDLRQFAKLALFFKVFPQRARVATMETLNSLAFRWRPLALSTIASRTIIRSARFDLSRLQVQKTSARPIAQQAVIVGSVITRGKRGNISHDGWASLETGEEPATRNRTMALLARGGDKQHTVLPSARMKPGAVFGRPSDYPGAGPVQSRVQALIRNTAAVGKKTFMLPKGQSGKFAPGLYKIKNRRGYLLPSTGTGAGTKAPQIQLLQTFGKKPKGPRFQWLEASVTRLLKHAPISKIWADSMRRAMGGMGK